MTISRADVSFYSYISVMVKEILPGILNKMTATSRIT